VELMIGWVIKIGGWNKIKWVNVNIGKFAKIIEVIVLPAILVEVLIVVYFKDWIRKKLNVQGVIYKHVSI
jgi:hypothetical protein